MTERAKSNLEIGAVISALCFGAAVIFNSGIQYARIGNLQDGQTKNQQDIKHLQDTNIQVGNTLVELRTLMKQVRVQLDQRKGDRN